MAGGGDQHVVGRVVPAKVADQALAIEAAHGVARAQDRAAQRVPAPVGLGEDLVHQVVRSVFDHLDFFLDDLAFVGDVLGVEERILDEVGQDGKGARQVLVQRP